MGRFLVTGGLLDAVVVSGVRASSAPREGTQGSPTRWALEGDVMSGEDSSPAERPKTESWERGLEVLPLRRADDPSVSMLAEPIRLITCD